MSKTDHTHPDHTCPRCRDDENRLRPDYVPPRRRPSERDSDSGHRETW